MPGVRRRELVRGRGQVERALLVHGRRNKRAGPVPHSRSGQRQGLPLPALRRVSSVAARGRRLGVREQLVRRVHEHDERFGRAERSHFVVLEQT